MSQEKDLFTGKIFFRLWIPAILSCIGWALSDIADAVVVGQKMGTVGLAAISLILPVYMIAALFAHGFGIGGSIRFSFLLGKGEPKKAVDTFNYTIQAALMLGILMAVLGNIFMVPLLKVLGTTPEDGELFTSTIKYLRIFISAIPLFFLANIFNYYLRNDDNQKLAGVGSVVGNLVDILFNIVFVVILSFGTAGAALATLVGQVVSVAIYLPGIIGKKHIVQLKRILLDIKYAFKMLKSGLASSVSYLFQLIFMLLCNNILIRLHTQESVAIYDLIQNTSFLVLYLYEGTSRAMQPLISTYFGEYNIKGTKTTLKYGFISGCVLGTAVITVFFLFPQLLCYLFGLEASAFPMAMRAIRIFVVGAFFGGISILICSYYQSLGNEKRSFIFSSLRGFIILIPTTVIFSIIDINYFWWLFPVTEASSLLIILICIFLKKQKIYFDTNRIMSYTIRTSTKDIGTILEATEEFCDRWQATMKQSITVTMTIEELCLAIMKNGFKNDTGYIQIKLIALKDGDFELHIRDTATSFNPFSLHTAKASVDGDFDMDAMGISVIRTKVKDFFYRQYGGFNSLIVKI